MRLAADRYRKCIRYGWFERSGPRQIFQRAQCSFVIIRLGHSHVAGFATIRTVVKAIFTQADALLRLAKAAILLARALRFDFVALHANGRHCGGPSTVAGVA